MFTGLVEETGTVASLDRRPAGGQLRVKASLVLEGIRTGDSVAVNGCCLTVASTPLVDGILAFDLLEETLLKTNLGDLAPGSVVNLERALAVGARLGGHFVQGHIDGATVVRSFEAQGADHRLEIVLPTEFARYVAYKGSIAIDGISLTVAEVSESSFTVWLIPHTLEVTNLRHLAAGKRVNIEYDLLAKYVERLVAVRRQ